MSKRDYYEILGANKNSTADELKKLYRKLAMQYHPDRNPGDKEAEKKFKEISEAYDVLRDPDKKAAYDRYGHSAFDGSAGGGGGFGGFSGASASDFADVFGDLFSDFMGGGRRGGGRSGAAQAHHAGADLRYNLEITLEDAFTGKQQEIKFSAAAKCETCDGTGSKDGSAAETCSTCQGYGKVRTQQGFFTIERVCTSCNGLGKVIKNPCTSCSGEGRVRKEKTLSVSVPEGIEDGTRIRLSGEGEVGLRGGPSGDLYIFITITPHSFFVREHNDLHCRVPIKMTTAAIGGEIEVPSIEGTRARVTIPAGTQHEDKFRLRNKGMPVMRSGGRRGDMYIHVGIETPVKLSKRQKELLEEFESLEDRGSNPKVEQFFGKVKQFWKELRD